MVDEPAALERAIELACRAHLGQRYPSPEPQPDAVRALTHRAEHTYEQYIELLAENRLAREVKLADLADNLTNNRQLPETPDVLERIARYERALARLSGG